MWKFVKATVVCMFLGLAFSGAALAASHPKSKPVKQKVAIFVFDTTSESFADLLSPDVSLGTDIASLFHKKKGVTWTINNAFLYLPAVQHGLDLVLAYHGDKPLTGWQPLQVTSSIYNFNNGYFQPAFLFAFYQEQVSAVPEASAGVMMALGLPVVGWLAWRRQRSGGTQSRRPA